MVNTPNEIELWGPFFVTKESLKTLDEIFEELFSNMIEIRKTELHLRAEKNKEYSYNKDKTIEELLLDLINEDKKEYTKRATIVLAGDTIISANSALECISNKSQCNRKCKTFNYVIKVGMKELTLKIKTTYGKSVVYNTSYIDEELKQKLFQKIEFWIDQYKPNIIVSSWNKFHAYIYIIVLFIYWIIFIINRMINNYSESVKKDIRNILDSGSITQDKINELIVNISKIYSDYVPKNYSSKKSNIVVYFDLALLFFGVISFIAPKTTIDYGKSTKWIKIWKLWIKLILVLIPGSIILPIILDKVL
jgi:hypothetical protein